MINFPLLQNYVDFKARHFPASENFAEKKNHFWKERRLVHALYYKQIILVNFDSIFIQVDGGLIDEKITATQDRKRFP